MEIINNLKNKRILGLIGIISLLLGVMTPYIIITVFGISQSLSLWSYWEGKVIFLLTIANVLFIFKDYVEKYVSQAFNSNIGSKIKNASPKMSLIPTILVVVFIIYVNTTISTDSAFFKHGIGFWLLWLGIVALVLHAIIYKGNGETENVIMASNTPNQNYNYLQNQEFNNNNIQSQQTNQSISNNNMGQYTNEVNQNSFVNTQAVVNANPIANNTTPSFKYCTACGTQLNQTDTVCSNCGKQIM